MTTKNIRSLLMATVFALSFGAQAASNHSGLSVYDDNEQRQLLRADKDKLLVVLWATWCPDCKSKLKGELKALASDPEIQVLAVNTEKNLKRVRAFIEKEKISVPVAYDTGRDLRKSLELFAVPSWAVLQKGAEGSLELIDKGSAFEAAKINAALGKSVF